MVLQNIDKFKTEQVNISVAKTIEYTSKQVDTFPI